MRFPVMLLVVLLASSGCLGGAGDPETPDAGGGGEPVDDAETPNPGAPAAARQAENLTASAENGTAPRLSMSRCGEMHMRFPLDEQKARAATPPGHEPLLRDGAGVLWLVGLDCDDEAAASQMSAVGAVQLVSDAGTLLAPVGGFAEPEDLRRLWAAAGLVPLEDDGVAVAFSGAGAIVGGADPVFGTVRAPGMTNVVADPTGRVHAYAVMAGTTVEHAETSTCFVDAAGAVAACMVSGEGREQEAVAVSHDLTGTEWGPGEERAGTATLVSAYAPGGDHRVAWTFAATVSADAA